MDTESVTPTLGRVNTAEGGRPTYSNEPRNWLINL